MSQCYTMFHIEQELFSLSKKKLYSFQIKTMIKTTQKPNIMYSHICLCWFVLGCKELALMYDKACAVSEILPYNHYRKIGIISHKLGMRNFLI